MRFFSPFTADSTFSKSKTGKTPLINPTFTSLSYLAFTVGVVIPVSLDICLKDFLPSSDIDLRIDTSILSRLRGIQLPIHIANQDILLFTFVKVGSYISHIYLYFL